MKFEDPSAALLRALTYGITCVDHPLKHADKHVDSAFRGAIDRHALGGTPLEYLAAIREALACTDDLAVVIGLDHSDNVIREFLRLIEARLVPRLEARPS